MVWEPEKCCCCGSVKTGTLILGWLGVIFSALHVLSMLRFAALSREDFVKLCDGIFQTHVDPELCAHGAIGGITSFALYSVLMMTICGMLLWGVQKFKPMMMIPYLIIHVIGIVTFGLISVIVFVVLAYYHIVLGAFILLIVNGLVMFLMVYLFLVVRACYKEVKQYSLAQMGGANIAYMEKEDIPYKMM